MRITRGSMQEQWFYDSLHAGASSAERYLRGRARQYAGRYSRSQSALFGRMRLAGYVIVRIPGPRGGEWDARYFAQLGLEDCTQ